MGIYYYFDIKRTASFSNFKEQNKCQACSKMSLAVKKKYKTLHCIKKTTVYENRTHRILVFLFEFVYALNFKHYEKKVDDNSIFLSDIHSKVLIRVRITFFVLH